MTRIFLLVLAFAALSVVPFLIWGAAIEENLTHLGAAEWMRSFGAWAWIVGILLITADIVLPVPATVVMAALGIIYGPWLGGLLSASGSILGGLIGYGVCRLVPEAAARRLAGNDGFARAHDLFAAWGGWVVAGSRWLPVLPETVSFLAGLTRMPFGRYLAALITGAAPMGLAYAWVGHLGSEVALLTMAVCAVAPLAVWFVIRRFLPDA